MACLPSDIPQSKNSGRLIDAFSQGLGHDQRACVTALQNFLDHPAKSVFLLKGNAGSGKTFLTRGLSTYLATIERAFLLTAFTGRAAQILRERTGYEAETLHRIIYEYQDVSLEDQEENDVTLVKKIGKIKQNEAPDDTVYIVDEASLISDILSHSDDFYCGTGCLLSDFMTYAQKNTFRRPRKIIFIGDPSQLPPIGMRTPPALHAAYFEKFGITDVSEYQLRDVMRQQKGSLILENAYPLANAIQNKRFPNINLKYGPTFQKTNISDALALYLDCYRKGESCTIITGSNRDAAELNEHIRKKLFPNTTRIYENDPLLIMKNTIGLTCRREDGTEIIDKDTDTILRLGLYNGDIVQAVSIDPHIETRTVQIKTRQKDETLKMETISLRFQNIIVAIQNPEYGTLHLSCKIIESFLFNHERDLTQEERRALLVDFRKRHPDLKTYDKTFTDTLKGDPYYNALRMKFGHALTCHKAQGSEWKTAIISCPSSKDPRHTYYYQWLYTAITRASQDIYIFNPPAIHAMPIINPFQQTMPLSAQTTDTSPPSYGQNTSIIDTTSNQDGSSNDQSDDPLATLANNVRSLLSKENIDIENIIHNQYQEAFYLIKDNAKARINIYYNGKNRIKSIRSASPSPLADLACSLLKSLEKNLLTTFTDLETPISNEDDRPFLTQALTQLKGVFHAHSIEILSITINEWQARITVARKLQSVDFDLFWNKKEQFKCYTPYRYTHGPQIALLNDVLTHVSQTLG